MSLSNEGEKTMYTLAIIHAHERELPKTLDLKGVYITTEQQLFHQLDQIHGVVIYQKKGQDPRTNFEWLLSIKRRRLLPVWIIDESENKLTRKLTIELGAIGVLDSNISGEEMFVLIKNTLTLIYPVGLQTTGGDAGKRTFQLNAQNHSINIPNRGEISLTHLEYKLLSLLDTKANQAFTYEDIHGTVWTQERDTAFLEKKYRIANMVFHIRSKLKNNGVNPNILRTVRSIGYLLDTTIEIVRDERGDGEFKN